MSTPLTSIATDVAPSRLLAAYARKQMERFETSLRASQENDEADAVHQLRVASRRLLAPTILCQAILPGRTVRRIERNLKKVRDGYRLVRDLDVIQTSLCDAAQPRFLDAEELAPLEGILARRRSRALADARRAIGRLPIDETTRRLRRTLENLEADDRTDDTIVCSVHSLLEARSCELLDKGPSRPDVTDLHPTRIAAKHLRYVVELMRHLKLAESDAPAGRLATFQEMLGRWNDELVAAKTISRIATKRKHLSRHTGWSARLLQYAATRAQRAEEQRQRVVDYWPEVVSVVAEVRSRSAMPDPGSEVSSPS